LTTIKETEFGASGRQRIMVVDNDQDMLRLLNRTLELEGFDTIVVADEDEALNLLEKLEPDMVIMDTGVPDAESLRTLDLMREHSDIPIIIITTDHEVETLRKVFSHGADDFIRKPFATRSFIARIRAKLRRYRQDVLQPS
jgi:DNA-binding response OmpR family regulator